MTEPRTLNEALRWRNALASEGKSLVLTNGCFDLLHPGHLRCLEWARSQGDALLVAINSDRSVRSLKGSGRPVWHETKRFPLLSSILVVDAVLGFDDDDVTVLLQNLQPNVFVKGADYSLETLHQGERTAVESYGGTISFAPLMEGWSTSALLENAVSSIMSPRGTGDPPIQTLFLDRDGVLNRERGFVTRPADLEILPGTGAAISRLNAADIECIVITNQSAIARGILDPAGLDAIHAKLNGQIVAAGGRLKGIYISPWHPGPLDGGRPEFIRDSHERKPCPGLIFKAAADHGLDLASCAFVGDSRSDWEAARAAGLRFFGVQSPKSDELPQSLRRYRDLSEVVDEIGHLSGSLNPSCSL